VIGRQRQQDVRVGRLSACSAKAHSDWRGTRTVSLHQAQATSHLGIAQSCRRRKLFPLSIPVARTAFVPGSRPEVGETAMAEPEDRPDVGGS
jgi:hypothetical protein